MTPEIRNLAANAAREIERGISPVLSLNVQQLARALGGEPLFDNIGHYARGHREYKDGALFSCMVVADLR